MMNDLASFAPHFVALILVVASAAFVIRKFWRKKYVLPLSKPSMTENMRMLQLQAGLTKLLHVYNICRTFTDGDFGRTKYGATFEFQFPTLDPFIVTTDFTLAKLYLQGDSKNDHPEAEKSSFIKALNMVDRGTNSILTHDTANQDRERARKALATSFSTTNLQQTWPYLRDGLIEEFELLRKLSQSGELLDCRQNILMFMLRMLGRSAFGVEITTDGTENESTINGLEYLEVQNKAGSERMKEMSNPLRRFYFWDKDVQAGAHSCRRVKEIAQKMMDLHVQRTAQGGSEAVTGEPQGPTKGKHHQSIMQLIASHAYPTEAARISDINVLTFAGHDTTGFSFCFLLMELARHPEIRAKLQAEIATVMPKQPLGRKSKVQQEGEREGSADGTQQLQHGDQKLLSAICGLEYLNCCIKESMRLWPVASIGSVRQLDRDMHWNGMLMPKGSSIRAHVFSMFRESWIDRPLDFLPERWSAENPQLPELKEMFIPFSLGKRACIGQNMAMFQLRIVAAYFLHNFDFELVGEPDFEYFITLKPVNLFLSVKERVVSGDVRSFE